jgi:hypothetical protein
MRNDERSAGANQSEHPETGQREIPANSIAMFRQRRHPAAVISVRHRYGNIEAVAPADPTRFN